MQKYQPSQFEQKWVEDWDKNRTYKAPDPKKPSLKGKQFIFPMFPYPSGAGLHVGHVRVYTGTDVVARFYRMNQYAVLHPMGWDAFGLPAENAAIKAKKNPMDMVPDHIATFKRQMKSLGFSYDWDREFSTTDPSYYKWTQWLFLQFYKMGLLYKKNIPINFCPSCKTGLAEEEVLANGTHERCGNKIEKKELPQWLFRITSYADRLLEDLKGLDWPRGILEMQKNWIGKSTGVNFKEKVKDLNIEFEVFDSVPQTFTAQTFTIIAPEHPLVKRLVKGTKYEKDVMEFVEKIKQKKISKKFDVEKDMEGIFTGRYVDNPFGTGDLPIWVASFVVYDYGTGIVNCSAHDDRDFAFAKKYNIPLRTVMFPKDNKLAEKVKNLEVCYHHEEDGIIHDPVEFNGMTWKEAREPIIQYIVDKGLGKRASHYHLRDWIFSRQRYWGEPIPMIECKKCGWVPVPESELPVKLPYVKSYEPTGTGESPLAAIKDWVNVACPECGGAARRETDTMPNWAGSCWYFLAFPWWKSHAEERRNKDSTRKNADNQRSSALLSASFSDVWKLNSELIKQWLPTDWYIGGAEHAVLHLLYARFWVKALYDLKLLDFKEPFTRLRNLGMILAEDHRKMSKSFGNIINPDDVMKEYGADALRVYEMFMAPFDQEIAWSTSALQGAYRFITRVWKMYQQYDKKTLDAGNLKLDKEARSLKLEHQASNIQHQDQASSIQYPASIRYEDKQLLSKLNKTIKKVTDDIPQVKFNTAIAAMMEFINEWEESIARSSKIFPQVNSSSDVPSEPLSRLQKGSVGIADSNIHSRQNFDSLVTSLSINNAKKFLQILAPFAPFTTEEIWQTVFHSDVSIHRSKWPKAEDIIVEEETVIPVQVNGKLRATIKVLTNNLSETAVVNRSLKEERVKKYLGGKKYKVIYVNGKVLNFVLE